jgi:hypothetical protein
VAGDIYFNNLDRLAPGTNITVIVLEKGGEIKKIRGKFEHLSENAIKLVENPYTSERLADFIPFEGLTRGIISVQDTKDIYRHDAIKEKYR